MEMITGGNCNECGQEVTPGEHSGHNARMTGAWYCHDCGVLCDAPDDPAMVWLSLIEEPPRNLDAIARLWDYSRHCEHPTPSFVFLCLIRDDITEGTDMSMDKFTEQLGEIELGLIAEALLQFSDRPTVAREYVADLLDAESKAVEAGVPW